jgi:hypothetical protein
MRDGGRHPRHDTTQESGKDPVDDGMRSRGEVRESGKVRGEEKARKSKVVGDELARQLPERQADGYGQ